MPFIVDVEQELLNQPEEEFYQELVRLREDSQRNGNSRVPIDKVTT